MTKLSRKFCGLPVCSSATLVVLGSLLPLWIAVSNGQNSITTPPGITSSTGKPEVGAGIGQSCTNDSVPCLDPNSECSAQGLCVCKKNFHSSSQGNGTQCVQQTTPPAKEGGGKKPPNYSSSSSSGENMVPMIVCLAIMFVGMCVALQLFSRARFRNQRTVFNSPNPRLLHLMKHDSKKRRHSHAGLGGGSRRPSCASNMSVPRGSRPSSRIGSRAGSPDLRKQAALNNIAVIDVQQGMDSPTKTVNAGSTELASLVEKGGVEGASS